MSIFALVDGNNFFVSCHRVIDPKLEGKPVVVLSHDGGIIVARSNEAKALGIKMAEPYFKAKSIIQNNNVICIHCQHDLYKDLSSQMMSLFQNHSPKIQVYSIDEAFLDYTGVDPHKLVDCGHKLKNDVFNKLGLPVSIGFAQTKTLAKFANHLAKTYDDCSGIYSFYDHEQRKASLGLINIGDVWGVGAQLEKQLKTNGIQTAFDLASLSLSAVRRYKSIHVERIFHELNGRVCFPLEAEKSDQKSLMESRTVVQPITVKADLYKEIARHVSHVCEKMRHKNMVSKEITLFIGTSKYTNGPKYENSTHRKLAAPTSATNVFLTLAKDMLDEIFKIGFRYKRSGITISHLVSEKDLETDIFEKASKKQTELSKSMDALNKRFGKNTVTFGSGHVK